MDTRAIDLFTMTELVTNNRDCVVLKVRNGNVMNLISLGCFKGNEEMFRLTKGKDVTCTVWRKEGKDYKCFSWHWGLSGYTLVCNELYEMGRIIQECIERCYKIKCQY